MMSAAAKPTATKATKATAIVTTLLLSGVPSCEKKKEKEGEKTLIINVNNVAIERAAIDALVGARLELHKAENDVRDNALAIAAAERSLQLAKMRKGIVEYNASRKRKAAEEANDHICDVLKSARPADELQGGGARRWALCGYERGARDDDGEPLC